MNRPCNCDRCETGKPWDSTQCRLCWLFHNDERYAALWNEPATMAEKIERVSTATAKWLAAGSPLRTREQLAECLAICGTCELYKPGLVATCGKCGCVLAAKARMATEVCPLGKWPIAADQKP